VSPVPPIRREVLVDADPSTAFAVFTRGIGQWWPIAELSVFGAGATVPFADKQLIETAPDGTTTVWGTVTRWDQPDGLAFTWHPGKSPEQASHVEVTFTASRPGRRCCTSPDRPRRARATSARIHGSGSISRS
jgi:hypothetical protein